MKTINIILIAILSFFSFKSFAQDDKKIDQLLLLHVDEKYDKLVDKAMDLTQHDDYRRHPLPFVYAAMGYYEMSKNPAKFDVEGRDAKYAKPLKNAQKLLYKFLKKDIKAPKYYNQSFAPDYTEFIETIADTSNKLGRHLFLLEQPRKSAGVYKNGYRATNDPILLLWQGLSEIESKNATEGDKNVLAALDSISKPDYKASEKTRGVMAHGMLLLEEYLAQKGDATNAARAKNNKGHQLKPKPANCLNR